MNKIIKIMIPAVVAMATCVTLARSSDRDDDYSLGESLTFSLDTSGFPDTVGEAVILSEYLPDGVEVQWTGKKFKTPKSSAPKVKKVNGDYEIVVNEKGEDNPSGLKLSYKKGKVSGSFKVYAVTENKKGKPKLKKFSAKVTGTMDAEDGLTVKISKIGTYTATLE